MFRPMYRQCFGSNPHRYWLLQVFETLLSHGATVIVIEHDRDVIHNADYIVDMGPGGGEEGGKIVASGTIEEIRNCPESITGRYL